jgi:hypothetical protein
LPRSPTRASHHALILSLTPPAPAGQGTADAANAGRIASLMGVPDANIRHLSGDALTLDGLRQALVDLDARIGEQDRAFIHIAADGARPRSAGSAATPSSPAIGSHSPRPSFTATWGACPPVPTRSS